MKIAVTYENGNVFGHFGHTENFKFYTVENSNVVSSEVVPTNGSGHGALAGFLKENGVDILICGGIGGGAKNALEDAGIMLFGGVSGNADNAVNAFLDKTLTFTNEATCSHHGHEHHGDCSSGGCGSSSCHH